MKTLAPGRLFAVRGGRFNTTEDFEKYKDRKTMQLSSELKQRLGLPTASTEERSEGSNITDVSKPNLSSSKSVSNEASSSINDVPPAAEGKNGEKLDGNELLATIDGLAKSAIRPFKKRLSVEEYKNVMRAVVRECYKKRILDEKTISSKVRKYVDALKNGEQLPSGHHVPKRSDGDDTCKHSVPVKRLKVES
ncbi:unnamed protein product [Nippostrongylus brasiliensis]|uniref:SRI domain-containing protein n=1 Tax=Nippostrongylus brasiliensis TaxID=27835 RepID=A0A0N4YQV6_NIPBR|nr:unnamed protein product [Nippostrongylus brasiliensis]